jgi:hypothetical protein
LHVIDHREAEIVRVPTTCAIGGAPFNSFGPQRIIIDEANQYVDPKPLIAMRSKIDQLTVYGTIHRSAYSRTPGRRGSRAPRSR